MCRFSFLLFVFFLNFSYVVMATPNCQQGHCSKVREPLNAWCIPNGLAGKPVMVLDGDSECFCMCSCMAVDTFLRRHDQSLVAIQSINLNENLYSPYSDLLENRVEKMLLSDYRLLDKPGNVRHIHFSNGSNIVVSLDHTFVAPHQKILAAEELQVGQSILAENYQPVQVVSNMENPQFTGKLMNLIINPESTEARHHFLVTNSVISGDWLVQANYSSFKTDIDVRLGKINIFKE